MELKYKFDGYDLLVWWDKKSKQVEGKGKDPDGILEKFRGTIDFPWFNPAWKGMVVPPEPYVRTKKIENYDEFSGAVLYIAAQNGHWAYPSEA